MPLLTHTRRSFSTKMRRLQRMIEYVTDFMISILHEKLFADAFYGFCFSSVMKILLFVIPGKIKIFITPKSVLCSRNAFK